MHSMSPRGNPAILSPINTKQRWNRTRSQQVWSTKHRLLRRWARHKPHCISRRKKTHTSLGNTFVYYTVLLQARKHRERESWNGDDTFIPLHITGSWTFIRPGLRAARGCRERPKFEMTKKGSGAGTALVDHTTEGRKNTFALNEVS